MEAHYIYNRGLTPGEEIIMGTFYNQDAQDLAHEILSDKTRDELRGRVEATIARLQDLIEGTSCGSTLTFKKENDEGKHYYYAAVKNGGRWYTTARDPRVLESDDQLIEWLIGLEIWDSSNSIALGSGSESEHLPIETTAEES